MIARHRAEGGMAVVATHGEIALDGARNLDLARHAVTADMMLAAGDSKAGTETERDAW